MIKRIIFLSFIIVILNVSMLYALSFDSIRDNMNSMTDLQFKRYAKRIQGDEIVWTGWIEEVKEKFLGGYEVWIDMDSPEELSVQDISFEVSENVALQLNKDRRVK